MERKIEFINLSHPSQGSSSSLQRRAYAHAARVTHARGRHARKATCRTGHVEPNGPLVKTGENNESTALKNICSVETGPRECPIVLPDPINHLTSSRRDHLGCFVRSLSPLEHYLFDHYVMIVTTQYGSQCIILKDSSFHHHQLRLDWIQLARSNVGLLNSSLLSTCRHLYEVYQREEYASLAMHYRILSIRAIREAIGAADCLAKDSIIATVISLALDEVRAGNTAASREHVRGLAKMIHYLGGPQALGMNGLLKHLFEKLAYDMGLLQDEELNSSELIDFIARGGINMPSAPTASVVSQ